MLEIQDYEEVWKLIAGIFPDRHQHALTQFTGLNPACGDSSHMSYSDAFKPFYVDELLRKICVFI